MAMTGWKMTMIEPTLDDLLDDEIMAPIMRSAGVDATALKASLGETARRLSERQRERVRRSEADRSLCCSA
jgi:hypothetical protein